MKVVTKSLVLMSMMACSAQAVTVVMDRGTTTGMKVVLPGTGDRVAIGQLIRWGTMSGAVSAANFTEFATTTVASVGTTGATATVPGSIRLDISLPGTQAGLANQQVFMWVYNSQTASATVDQGLFTSTAWTLPGTFATDGTASFNLTLGQNTGLATPAGPVITTLAIQDVGAATLTVGSVQNTPTGAINTAGYIYTLGQAIPEPSAALLGAFGALGLLRRRRN